MKKKSAAKLTAVPNEVAVEPPRNRAAVLRLFGIAKQSSAGDRGVEGATNGELIAQYFSPWNNPQFALGDALNHEALAIRLIAVAAASGNFSDLELNTFGDDVAQKIKILTELIARAESDADAQAQKAAVSK
jgi:hypothetical protein